MATTLFFVLAAALPYALSDLILQSAPEVKASCARLADRVETGLDQFVDLSQSGQVDRAYQLWSDLQFNYLSFTLELDRTRSMTKDSLVKQTIESEWEKTKERVQKAWFNQAKLLPVFLKNANAPNTLNAQQRGWTESILQEYQAMKQLPSGTPSQVAGIKESFSRTEGVAALRNPQEIQSFSIFTANLSCFPGKLPYLYGGIGPWKDRISSLVELIRKAGADIVCLQEIWDPLAMRALKDQLKEDYAWFIDDAGDPAGTLQVEKMGYSSGLFIAGRLPLASATFHRFSRSLPATSNRGALLVVVQAQSDLLAVINTHLQHGDEDLMKQVRKEQLATCHALLKGHLGWGCLVGDLNIDGFSPELKSSELATLFDIPSLSAPTAPQPTSTNYFSELVLTPLDLRAGVRASYEWLDYCVPLPHAKGVAYGGTHLIPLFQIEAPTDALSDHHALLTTWKLQQNPLSDI